MSYSSLCRYVACEYGELGAFSGVIGWYGLCRVRQAAFTQIKMAAYAAILQLMI